MPLRLVISFLVKPIDYVVDFVYYYSWCLSSMRTATNFTVQQTYLLWLSRRLPNRIKLSTRTPERNRKVDAQVTIKDECTRRHSHCCRHCVHRLQTTLHSDKVWYLVSQKQRRNTGENGVNRIKISKNP